MQIIAISGVGILLIRKLVLGFDFHETSHMKKSPWEMAKSLCHLPIQVKMPKSQMFNIANMSFNAIHKNKIVAKIFELTVTIYVFNTIT